MLLNTALAHLLESGVEIVETISVAALDHLPAQGARWKQEGIEVVIAAGGDGLIGGVITHIAESGLPLGILPLGTANDIARSLNIPLDLDEAARVIAGGTITEADIGVARLGEARLFRAYPDHRPERAVCAHRHQRRHAQTLWTPHIPGRRRRDAEISRRARIYPAICRIGPAQKR